MGSNQFWAGRVSGLCVFSMTVAPEGSTESGLMEKPGIKPAFSLKFFTCMGKGYMIINDFSIHLEFNP